MTQATFDSHLKGARLIELNDDKLIIGVKSVLGKDWLENRLSTTIGRTVASIIGQAVELQFVVVKATAEATATAEAEAEATAEATAEAEATATTGDIPTPEQQPAAPAASPALDIPRPDPTGLVKTADFDQLWQKSGFTQIPDYAIRYWRMWLGRSFDLLEFLISEDKRSVKKMREKEIPYWTPPKKYSYGQLSRVLRCSRKTLTGRFVTCGIYESQKRQAKERGEVLPEAVCCGKYKPHKMRPYPGGGDPAEMECVHWLEGLLERLYREGFIAVERVKTPGRPRSHRLRLQAWRLLPTLTPFQVAQLSEVDQVRHKYWLERYGHHGGFDLTSWEKETAASLVSQMPGYDWGRQLFDVYLNNPLLGKNKHKNR